MQVETLIERSIVEVDALNSEWMLYTSDEMTVLKAIIREQADGNTNMGVTDYVDMCVLLARI